MKSPDGGHEKKIIDTFYYYGLLAIRVVSQSGYTLPEITLWRHCKNMVTCCCKLSCLAIGHYTICLQERRNYLKWTTYTKIVYVCVNFEQFHSLIWSLWIYEHCYFWHQSQLQISETSKVVIEASLFKI